MFDVLSELFLNEYFTVTSALGEPFGEDKKLFDKLARVYLLSESEKKKLAGLAFDEVVADVRTERDYKQFNRVRTYAEMTGIAGVCTPAQAQTVAVKGGAIEGLKFAGLKAFAYFSAAAAYKAVSDRAEKGFITATRLLGIMLMEGIYVDKDEKQGLKLLNRAAQWSDIPALMAALYYDPAERNVNLARLHAAALDGIYMRAYERAQEAYSMRVSPLDETLMLQRAFSRSIVRREIYEPHYARIIFGTAIDGKDKEKLVFTSNKGMLAEAADLPLKLSMPERQYVRESAFARLPFIRPAEKQRVLAAIKNSDLRALPAYRPPCLRSDSKYMLGLYAEAIKNALGDVRVETIDVASLTEYDLDPSKNNIFVRNCDEDKNNVYMLYLRGAISERAAGKVCDFLQSEKRRRFRLNNPAISIDLGAILPICFCDGENARTLSGVCETIDIANPDVQEKRALAACMLEEKARLYGVTEVKFGDGAQAELLQFGADEMEIILDKAIRGLRFEGDKITLTADKIRECAGGVAHTAFGFGGVL